MFETFKILLLGKDQGSRIKKKKLEDEIQNFGTEVCKGRHTD